MAKAPLRTVLYRRLKRKDDLPPKSKEELADLRSLEDALKSALNIDDGLLAADPRERVVSAPNNRRRVMGNLDQSKTGLFGAVYEYEPDSHQAVLKFLKEIPKDPTKEAVEVTQFAPGPNQEFIRNWAMFFVVGDHVVFIQSYTYGGKMLEEYFEGLLRKGKIIGPELVRLKGQFDLQKLGRDRGRIKEVIVGDTVLVPDKGETSTIKKTGKIIETTSERVIGSSEKDLSSIGEAIVSLCQVFGFKEHQAEALLENRDPDTKLTIQSKIIASTRNKEWRETFYRAVESTVSGLDHRDIKIRTATGTINGEQATLTDEQRITLVGSLPIINEAWATLRKVYERWRDDDKLDV